MNETPHDPRPPTCRAAEFVQGSAMAGFAVFLAACGTSRHVGRAVDAPRQRRRPPLRARPRRPRRARPPRRRRSRRWPTELNWANWTYYMDVDPKRRDEVPDARGLQGEVRDDGQLPGGDRRQRRLRRHDQAAARGRPGHRLGPDRPDRLDGRPADPARLGRADGPRQHAERRRQPAGRLQERHLGPDQRPPRAVAVGHDRARLRPGEDRRPDQPRRPVRPQVQGQGRLPDRDARHDRPDDAQARARPVEGDQRPTATRRSPRSRRPATPASSARSRATSTPRTSSRGDVVLSMAWSGDMVQALDGQADPARSRSPTRAAMLWTDNMHDPEGRQERVHGRRS